MRRRYILILGIMSYTTTTIRVEEEKLEKFDKRAEEMDLTRSQVIRGLIDEFLEGFPSLEARGDFGGILRPFAGEHLDEESFIDRISENDEALRRLNKLLNEVQESER